MHDMTDAITLDDDRFWAFIAAARDAAGDDVEDRVSGLEQVLLTQHPDDVAAFQNKYDELLARACRWDLWGAALVINGGCSDDGFRYFRDWLISEGEAVFEAALADPDGLADVAQDEAVRTRIVRLRRPEVYEQLTDAPLPRGSVTDPASPAGQEWNEDDLPALFPRLARRFAA